MFKWKKLLILNQNKNTNLELLFQREYVSPLGKAKFVHLF